MISQQLQQQICREVKKWILSVRQADEALQETLCSTRMYGVTGFGASDTTCQR
jgi:Uri superfamily endonuclease